MDESNSSSVPANSRTSEQMQPQFRWVVLGLAALTQTTASIVAQGIYTLVPAFQAAFSLSQAQAALVVAAVNGGQVLSMLALGWLIDRHGERNVVGITMLLMGGVAFIGAQAACFSFLLLSLIALGACYAAVQPGGTRAILRWFPPAQRGMATGIRQSGLPLGTALAAMVLPWLAQHHGWHFALMVQAAVGAAGGAMFWLLYRTNSADKTPATPTTTLSLVQIVRELARYSALWPVMLAGVAMVTFQYTFATHILTFLMNRFELPMVAAAMLYAVSQWVGIAGRIGLAWASDRLWPGRRVRSLGITMMVCVALTLVLVMLPATTPTPLLAGLFVAIGVFGVGWYPLYLLQVAEMAPKAAVASTISFSMTLNMIAICLVPPAFGLMVDLSGYTVAWMILAASLTAFTLHLFRGTKAAEAARQI